MGTLISVVTISLFLAILIVKKIDIAWYIKHWCNIPQSRRMKPLDCLPCFSFWIAFPVAFVLFMFKDAGLFTYAVSIMATYVVAYTIQK